MSHLKRPDGTNLYYEDLGDGKPLVFIHGWPLSGAMWEYQVVPLTKARLRCVTYDRRGFGRSDKPATGYDYKTLGEDLAGLIEHLDLRDATLVGFSMGGGEVAEYVTRHNTAGRVTQAILISSILPYMLKSQDNPNGVPATDFGEMTTGLEKDRPAFLTDFTEKFFGVGHVTSPVSNPMIAANCELAMTASPIATLECLDSFASTDFRGHMGRFNIPTLVIHGDSDKTVPIKATGEVAARTIPNAKYKVYSGAPHGLFYTEREMLNRDIIDFISTGRRV
jgi:non-heme chloroperoxidase